MATHVPTRQPFAAIDSPRLQSLANLKNRQNAIPTSFSAAPKPTTLSSPVKRRYEPFSFEEDYDSENIDPSVSHSPSKRFKTFDATPMKPSQFFLIPSLSAPKTASPAMSAPRSSSISSPISPKRKAMTSPNTANTTPISISRGSPKHKRVGLLSKRRNTSSPFRRIDPPSFSSSSLPFSIDAALSGTIPSYTPKSPLIEPSVPTLEESMPKSWFFDIHEDSPEQEAANLMEHSASVLDISSDDDGETKRRNEEKEKGKENIPPSDLSFVSRSAATSIVTEGENQATTIEVIKESKLRRKLAEDAMIEDRCPLSDLPAEDYYGSGLDASSCVTVDSTVPENPSGLSKELKDFDFTVSTPTAENAVSPASEEQTGEETKYEVAVWEESAVAQNIEDVPCVENPLLAEATANDVEAIALTSADVAEPAAVVEVVA